MNESVVRQNLDDYFRVLLSLSLDVVLFKRSRKFYYVYSMLNRKRREKNVIEKL